MVLFVISVVLIHAAQARPVAEPPMPDFKERVDYVQWLKDQLKSADADNAYQEYRVFLETDRQPTIPKPVDEELSRLLGSPQPWTSADHPGLANWLEGIKPALSAYEKGTTHKFLAMPLPEASQSLTKIMPMPPGLGPSRLLSRAMVARAWQADTKFDPDSFTRNIALVLRYNGHISQGLTLVNHLTALGVKMMAYESIVQAIRQDLLPEGNLAQLLSMLQKDDAINCFEDFQRSLKVELATMYDCLQMLFTENGKFQPRPSRAAVRELLTDPGRKFPQDQVELALKEDDPLALCHKLKSYVQDLSQLIHSGPPKNVENEFKKRAEQLNATSPFFQLFVPNLSRPLSITTDVEARRRGGQVLTALIIHKKKHSRWPAKLSELPLEPSLLIDPYSNQPFIYQMSNGEMRLYSVGPDGVDNGGTKDATRKRLEGEDLIIWPLGSAS